MYKEKENAIVDYIKRSDEEQMRLYIKGLSKCDGVRTISAHQRGKAVDIYFLNENLSEVVPPKKGHEYWHKYWKRYCKGQPMIEWDQGHFE